MTHSQTLNGHLTYSPSSAKNYFRYMKCDKMAAKAIEAVKSGELRIIPDIHEKTWYHWMENIRDWCISRQLWWGHRIPAFRVRIVDSEVRYQERNLSNFFNLIQLYPIENNTHQTLLCRVTLYMFERQGQRSTKPKSLSKT